LAAYILNLPVGTTLIGVSAYDASRNLNTAAIGTLSDIGVDVGELAFAWKFAFVAVKGSPQSSVREVRRSRGSNLVMIVTVTPFAVRGLYHTMTQPRLQLLLLFDSMFKNVFYYILLFQFHLENEGHRRIRYYCDFCCL
jgi:hypothetical protein